ncbi:hypothetical protein KU75_25085 [Pectobacterium odoriferum]|uniref:Uncharacterized protein n=1 Tax=Pectobacterium odoriferum TaxID=78398 RepID=A0ABR4VI99_9GAMM|nr:hypothetical protein [Pectobacterium odoriferum]KGA39038.1 hypothetical protein KU75_25085 [Pectobacterium odoriferum]
MSDINDFQNESESQQSVAMKISLPERLHNDVSLFANYLGMSKAEFSREVFSNYLDNSTVWKSRSYFFQPKDNVRENQGVSVEEKLKLASKGCLIKVAALQVDSPDRANMVVGNLVRIKGREVSFDIPHNYRPTHIANSIPYDTNNVKMVSGHLVIPQVDKVLAFGGESTRFIYTVDIDYIWDVDTAASMF